MCCQPSGATWRINSGETSWPRRASSANAGAKYRVFQRMIAATMRLRPEAAIGLVFERTIAQLAEAVEKDRPRERVARFALVEAKTGAPTQLGIAVPAEHEERSFYSADVPQGHRQSVCPGAGL